MKWLDEDSFPPVLMYFLLKQAFGVGGVDGGHMEGLVPI